MTASDPRRLVSAGAVLLLHLIVITAFVVAFRATSNAPVVTHEIEIVFPALARRPPALLQTIRPQLMRPDMPRAIAPAISTVNPPASTARPATGAISGVGRALFGCDPEKLDLLSPDARASCLRLAPGKRQERSVRLGPPPNPNSPFTKEIEERFRKARPIIRPCPLGGYNDTRGLPCFGFDQ